MSLTKSIAFSEILYFMKAFAINGSDILNHHSSDNHPNIFPFIGAVCSFLCEQVRPGDKLIIPYSATSYLILLLIPPRVIRTLFDVQRLGDITSLAPVLPAGEGFWGCYFHVSPLDGICWGCERNFLYCFWATWRGTSCRRNCISFRLFKHVEFSSVEATTQIKKNWVNLAVSKLISFSYFQVCGNIEKNMWDYVRRRQILVVDENKAEADFVILVSHHSREHCSS